MVSLHGKRVTDSAHTLSAYFYLAGHLAEHGEYKGGELDVADYDKQLMIIPVHAPGTCEWLALHPSFLDWFTSDSSEVLWLRGYAGVGKSVITKYLVTNVIGSSYVQSKRNSTCG